MISANKNQLPTGASHVIMTYAATLINIVNLSQFLVLFNDGHIRLYRIASICS